MLAADAGYLKLIELGIALSAERNFKRLMEMILLGAKDLCRADGGTLYLREGDFLRFAILRNDSLNTAMGGTTGKEIPFPPLRLYDEEGKENHKNVSTSVALTGRMVNIEDAYDVERYDFTGTKKFDAGTGYRSKSFLTVPLKNHKEEVIGVLQLINAISPSGEVVSFGKDLERLIEALSSQAAIALDNQQLLEAQKNLLESFIKVIAGAIDAKSPYTGGHCQRVPVITQMLAQAAVECQEGPFKDFTLDEDDWYELHIAAWLHDCGKVTTPEHVVDKATKLETIYDRVHEVRTRFEVLKKDAEIAYLKGVVAGGDEVTLRAGRDAVVKQLDEDRAFIETINVGGEFMAPDKVERLKRIAALRWTNPEGQEAPFLTENEVYNLSIARGTLTEEERKVINDHIVLTIDMLGQLPFPPHMRHVVEYAGGHHEKMDGTGYPNKLLREQLSLPARIMAIADIFEALTAADRPYKKGKTLSETIKIMSFMKKDKHIDPDLFELFLETGVWKKYAEQFMKPEQIDEVD
ncbi:MAG: GAF domain-containing protein, partial [Rhodospirillales bacterium]|nr:GAF domain-containing protein [Rhodospirillales bacterium]